VVFCAAGVIHTGGLLASDFEDIEHVLNVNLWGVINTAKAFLPGRVAAGRGHIVTFSSGLGLIAAPRYSGYSASKFAVRGFTESLRQELALDGHRVSVTCVYPGGVRTPIMRNGRFAAGEDPDAVIRRFDTKVAGWTRTGRRAPSCPGLPGAALRCSSEPTRAPPPGSPAAPVPATRAWFRGWCAG
jgi:short-subunit dehydrogenase